MSTDRELLELAAKAAGLSIDKSKTNGGGHWNTGFNADGSANLDCHNGITWNPLADDGDALRLAVALSVSVGIRGGTLVDGAEAVAGAPPDSWHFVPVDADKNGAVRRAIVLAAAEIWRRLI